MKLTREEIARNFLENFVKEGSWYVEIRKRDLEEIKKKLAKMEEFLNQLKILQKKPQFITVEISRTYIVPKFFISKNLKEKIITLEVPTNYPNHLDKIIEKIENLVKEQEKWLDYWTQPIELYYREKDGTIRKL